MGMLIFSRYGGLWLTRSEVGALIRDLAKTESSSLDSGENLNSEMGWSVETLRFIPLEDWWIY